MSSNPIEINTPHMTNNLKGLDLIEMGDLFIQIVQLIELTLEAI